VLNIAPELSAEEGASTQDAIINLIALALRSSPEIAMNGSGTDAVNLDMKEQIIRFIENNIASTNLGIAMIQKRFHISRAHLYRIFDAESGIASFIRNKRLDFALQSLMKGQYSNITAKQLAHLSGFKSPELLNRLFREKFGMSPKELVKSGELARFSAKSGFDLHDHMREQVLNAAQIINAASSK
jgi:AraC-like DNA-binding protein